MLAAGRRPLRSRAAQLSPPCAAHGGDTETSARRLAWRRAVDPGRLALSLTDPEELAKRAWLDLDGVTDDWIKGVEVEKIAGGGDPPRLAPAALAALIGGKKSCCNYGCCGEMEHVMRLTGEWALIKPRFWDPAQPPRGETTLVQSSR